MPQATPNHLKQQNNLHEPRNKLCETTNADRQSKAVNGPPSTERLPCRQRDHKLNRLVPMPYHTWQCKGQARIRGIAPDTPVHETHSMLRGGPQGTPALAPNRFGSKLMPVIGWFGAPEGLLETCNTRNLCTIS